MDKELNKELFEATSKICITIEQYEFVKYVYKFYGKNGIYDMNVSVEQIIEATNLHIDALVLEQDNPCYDSFDREQVRDIMIEKYNLVFPTNVSDKKITDQDLEGLFQ